MKRLRFLISLLLIVCLPLQVTAVFAMPFSMAAAGGHDHAMCDEHARQMDHGAHHVGQNAQHAGHDMAQHQDHHGAAPQACGNPANQQDCDQCAMCPIVHGGAAVPAVAAVPSIEPSRVFAPERDDAPASLTLPTPKRPPISF